MNLKTKVLTAVTALILGASCTFNAGAVSTELHTAVKDGDIEKVRKLCEEHPEWVNEFDENYFDPISYAANGEILKCLIENGADANKALYGLSQNGLEMNSESIKYLQKHGANIGMCLIDAVHINDLDLIEYLIERGADPNDGLTPAFYDDNLDLFKYFVKHGASKGLALYYAIQGNNIELVKYLVEEHGADATDTEILFRAVGKNCSGVDNTEVLEYLVRRGADVNKGFSYCFMDSNFKLAKWFIDHGADINMKDEDGDTILHASVNYLRDMEQGAEKYQFIPETYVKEECEKVREIVEFLRANGAHE